MISNDNATHKINFINTDLNNNTKYYNTNNKTNQKLANPEYNNLMFNNANLSNIEEESILNKSFNCFHNINSMNSKTLLTLNQITKSYQHREDFFTAIIILNNIKDSTHKDIIKLIKQSDFVIVADGAANNIAKEKNEDIINKINYVVGDFDSIEDSSIKILESFNNDNNNNNNIKRKNNIIFEKINCQDTTDLQKCYKVLKREFIDNEHVKNRRKSINNIKALNDNYFDELNKNTLNNSCLTDLDLNKQNKLCTSINSDNNISNEDSNSNFFDYENKLRKINNNYSHKEIKVNLNFYLNDSNYKEDCSRSNDNSNSNRSKDNTLLEEDNNDYEFDFIHKYIFILGSSGGRADHSYGNIHATSREIDQFEDFTFVNISNNCITYYLNNAIENYKVEFKSVNNDIDHECSIAIFNNTKKAINEETNENSNTTKNFFKPKNYFKGNKLSSISLSSLHSVYKQNNKTTFESNLNSVCNNLKNFKLDNRLSFHLPENNNLIKRKHNMVDEYFDVFINNKQIIDIKKNYDNSKSYNKLVIDNNNTNNKNKKKVFKHYMDNNSYVYNRFNINKRKKSEKDKEVSVNNNKNNQIEKSIILYIRKNMFNNNNNNYNNNYYQANYNCLFSLKNTLDVI